jgi:secondary thiamine-phosphate synthase enzyme
MVEKSSRRFQVATRGQKDVVDLGAMVGQWVRETGIREGILHLFVLGSTAALTTIENEKGLIQDLGSILDELVPAGRTYLHSEAGGDDNAPSHIWASIIGPSISIPVEAGRLSLGTWQQVVLIELDVRPRTREIVAQLVRLD